MSHDPGRIAFVVAAGVFLGWFAIGTELNLRRGRRLLRWVEGGLPRLGPRSTLRWLGSSALELKVQEAREPLRNAELFILLEPRDLPIVRWLFRLRGRRDLLIVRADLPAPPRFEFEAFDPRAWSTRGVRRTLQRKGWAALAAPPGSPVLAFGPGPAAPGTDVVSLATLPELPLVRVAIRREAPHLEVQWRLDALAGLEAIRVFDAVRALAERV